MVDKVIADSPKQLEQYRGGKTKLKGYFAGQVCFHSVLKLVVFISCWLLTNMFDIVVLVTR